MPFARGARMNHWIGRLKYHTAISLTAVIFTVCIGSFLAYDLHKMRDHTREKALTEARSLFNLNLAYRRWNAGQGGVYVPVIGAIRPNPHLGHYPKRDLTTTDGTKLTLVNPAMMTRYVHEILSENQPVPFINKVTSLKTINPANAPDPWEAKQLQTFERGVQEASEMADIAGEPYFRLMKPFLTEEACLGCHAAQGYALGDVRGALSIGVPMKPYLEREAVERKRLLVSNVVIWVIGMVGIGLLGIVINKAERAAEKERVFTDAAINSLQGVFFVLDGQGRYVRWNKAVEEAWGKPHDRLRGREALLLMHPDDRPRLSAKITEVMEKGSGVVEGRLLPSGTDAPRDYLFFASRMVSEGRPYVVGTGVDVTERKIMQEKIQAASAEWLSTFDAIHDSIMILDCQYRILRCNNATARLFGKPHKEIIGHHCWELAHQGEIPTDCPMADVLSGKKREVKVLHILGRTCMVTADPILDPAGNVLKIVHTVSDITEQKKLEAELHQAQKMEAVGALAGGVAHDFNNILSAIVGFGSILRRKLNADDPLRQYLDPILLSAERATTLTKTLLAFSRKEAPKLQEIDINVVLAGFEKIVTRLIGEDIELNLYLCPGPLYVKADQSQIEQVLMNFATNARDAMPKGGRLTLSTERIGFAGAHAEVLPGDYALISVSDTGIGIDKAAQEHIFEPFFTTKEAGKGTGLGLAIVYGIVKNHGGSVHVYSEPGMGTMFKVLLPLLDIESVSERHTQDYYALPNGTETILLAEDDESARQVAKMLLEEQGYTVFEAVDGEDAVAKFREHKDSVELVLSDVVMPKKNGWEAYEEMKKTQPALKAVFMSGYSAEIITQKGFLDEEAMLLSKPLIPTELFRSIRTALEK